MLQAQPRERGHGHADHLGIDRGTFGAQEVNVPLIELAQPAALRALGAEEVGHREPLDGHGKLRSARGRHAREGRREFRAQRVVVAAAGAAKAEELVDDALAALGGVELEMLERGAVDLVEAERDARVAPRGLDAAAHGHLGGIEVAGALG